MKKILTKRDLGLTSEEEPTKFLVTDAPVLPAEYFRQTTTPQQAEPEPAMSQGNGLDLGRQIWRDMGFDNDRFGSVSILAAAIDGIREADAKRIADAEAERDALKDRVEELAGLLDRMRAAFGDRANGDLMERINAALRASEGGADPAASPLSEGDGRA